LSVLTYTYLYSLQIFPLLFIFLPILWSIFPIIPSFILYLSVLTYTYLYSRLISFIQFWPRTFYRSGWLRCDVLNCVFMFWADGVLLVFRSDCRVFDCISSQSEQNWCFVLV
jgi:hypothetical protein